MVSEGSLGCQVFQRGWNRLRLVTEQGSRPALNSERIASLYGLEGYRLVLIGCWCRLGELLELFVTSAGLAVHWARKAKNEPV